ncbi:hypothetical protein GGI12_001377 [Dipsacomyces acuminosporus]|nr:hypothetical protein GGI12_001377 [Dipsacomyces acuminosporus]
MDVLTEKLAGASLDSSIEAPPGLEEAFQSLLEVVQYPIQHLAKFQHLNIDAPKGVLLYGPPGVGKTHLVRTLTKYTGAHLTVVQGPEILGPYLGESERRLREKFAEAERATASDNDSDTSKKPSILFVDEIDSIAPNRQQTAGSGSGQFEARIVAQLLTLMDGLESRGKLVVIGATNLPNSLDPALRRPGRFDREISIDVPNQMARAKILRFYTRKMPLSADLDIEELAESTNGYVGADIAALCREAATHAISARLDDSNTRTDMSVGQADFTEAMRRVVPSIKRGLGIDVAETKWEDVGGLSNVKLKLMQAVQWPLEHAETMSRLGVRAPRGILMYGPPGCSKTTLVKIIATQTKATFFSINGAALYSPYVGDSERAVREVFKRARASSPSVIFFDEVEAIVGKRAFSSSSSGAGGDSVQERVLSTLLNEMDGVEGDGAGGNVLVVGATNRIDMMDAALLRPGRFDRIVYVPPPDRDARREILAIRGRKMPLHEDVDFDRLADLTEGFSGADLANLSREAALLALRRDIDVKQVSSFSSTSFLRAGSHTPQNATTLSAPPPTNTISLNQQGKARCIQTLSQRPISTASNDDEANDSVLTLAQSDYYVFSGSQRGDIHVWSRDTYRVVRTLHAHTAGCLSLALDPVRGVLFSGGGDGKVRAWDIETLKCLYVVHAGVNSGAVLSLAYSETLDLLVLGCQNTSIQLFNIAQKDSISKSDRLKEMAARKSRFFDDAVESIAVCGSFMPPAISDTASDEEDEIQQYVLFDSSIVDFAHSGYVYSLLFGRLPSGTQHGSGEVLYSAGSDGEIKVWSLGGSLPEEIVTLDRGTLMVDGDSGDDVCVHSLALDDELLFAGLQSGEIEVWDLETMQRIRVLTGHSANVFTLLVHSHCLYSGSADGTIRMWGSNLQSLGWISSDSGNSILCMDVSLDDILISGSGDSLIAFWDIVDLDQTAEYAGLGLAGGHALGLHGAHNAQSASDRDGLLDEPVSVLRRQRRGRRMMQALDQWIRFKSVSGVPELQPECRRAARFLKDLMRQLGASDARLISSTPSSNPLVYGRFDASRPGSPSDDQPLETRPTVFVYGHYDVMPAGDEDLWRTSPFELVGKDGYLYGRGVSDDKGPVLATLFAVSELYASGQLPITVVFCIEGEEEHGSLGLHETMVSHRSLFGQPRLILLSSSYWLGESTPCLTYGMRGSIRANLRVESTRHADVHAGVWGGAVSEPLTCLTQILSRLADSTGHVLIPGFHDSVRAVSKKEEAAMRELVSWITAKEARAPLVTRTVLSPSESAGSPLHSLSPSTSVRTIDSLFTGPSGDCDTATVHSIEERARADLYDQLMQRWRFPTLTVHHVDVSTVAARNNATLIPAAAQAALSVRVVPDQSLEDIAEKLRTHVEAVFDEIRANRKAGGHALLDELKLHLDVRPNAQWWLADPETPVYQATAKAIREEWQQRQQHRSGGNEKDDNGDKRAKHVPLLIREGGSIPAVPWLEAFFAPHAVAVNLPMGQSSDNAHLDNERIALENLLRGRQVIWRLLKDIDQALGLS